jgi:putative FmdB family regulatory protein
MPLYEYRCDSCDVTFEVLVRTDTVVACPQCGSLSLSKLLPMPFISSGRTARQPGHTCCGQAERCDAPPCSTGETCRREP